MIESPIIEVLLDLAILVGLTYALASALVRLRIPPIISALLLAMVAHYTFLGDRLASEELAPMLGLLAELGMLFLLFYIGTNVDLPRLSHMRGDIGLLTLLNTGVPLVLGTTVMLSLGYDWMTAIVIGLTCMPTAEAVIVPILDEFRMLRTRVGQLIVGAGTLDDVFEVLVIAVVSVWLGERAGGPGANVAGFVTRIGVGMLAFGVLTVVSYRWFVPWLSRLLPPEPRNQLMLSVAVLFTFGGIAELIGIGVVIGAVAAGIVMQRVLGEPGEAGSGAGGSLRTWTYGFFGLLFFYWIGLNADLQGLVREPLLAILLWLAASVGKIIGVLLMVPMKRLRAREAWTVGIGLDARLTTEIIVAKILLDAGVIDTHVFTALVAAAALSTVAVPLAFTFVMRAWGEELKGSSAEAVEHR